MNESDSDLLQIVSGLRVQSNDFSLITGMTGGKTRQPERQEEKTKRKTKRTEVRICDDSREFFTTVSQSLILCFIIKQLDLHHHHPLINLCHESSKYDTDCKVSKVLGSKFRDIRVLLTGYCRFWHRLPLQG